MVPFPTPYPILSLDWRFATPYSIISGTGKATNFNFCTQYAHS